MNKKQLKSFISFLEKKGFTPLQTEDGTLLVSQNGFEGVFFPSKTTTDSKWLQDLYKEWATPVGMDYVATIRADVSIIVPLLETSATVCYSSPVKQRELTSLSQLTGLTIKTVKTVKDVTVFRTHCDASLILKPTGVVKMSSLGADELLALGFLSKEEIATIKKAKSLGIL